MSELTPVPPPPGSEAERMHFCQLQLQLLDRFERFRSDPKMPYTTVVIPSQSVDPDELAKIPGVARYEERSLFNLMLLRRPRQKIIFVTSKRIDPLVVDYYLHQMRGVPPAHARRRLLLLDCDDDSPQPLSAKLLERPRLVQRIRDSIDDLSAAHLNIFNASPLERTLSVRLGIPLNACDPALIHLGSKTGSRQVFADAGLTMAQGVSGLRDVHDLARAVVDLHHQAPETHRVVVKLNESFSGEGNALLTLPSGPIDLKTAQELLPSLKYEAAGEHWEHFAAQIDGMGCIVEEWIEGEGKTSPSVQMRINPAHEVQVVSTHDQLLGGPSGQVFLGATFPAAMAYRLALQAQGRAVGDVLAQHGVIGRFGVDFLVVPGEPPAIYAVEINLRQGGTTHPFNTMKFLTDGTFDEEQGCFLTAQGQARTYFATDALASPAYRGILPFDLLDRLVLEDIHFRADETGMVFHLMGCLSQFGKLGCTAIAPTIPEARNLYAQTVELLDDMSQTEC